MCNVHTYTDTHEYGYAHGDPNYVGLLRVRVILPTATGRLMRQLHSGSRSGVRRNDLHNLHAYGHTAHAYAYPYQHPGG